MDNIHSILQEISHTSSPCVLATIISIEGSSYRKKGTSMLFTAAGKQVGILSAGCLEEDLAIRANDLLHNDTRDAQVFSYDMSSEDDLSWGKGAGCNGKIHILLERIDDHAKVHLHLLHKLLLNGTPVKCMKVYEKESGEISVRFVPNGGQSFGTSRSFPGDETDAQLNHKNKKSQTIIYTHQYNPMPRLFIFGAGPDVDPLVKLAVAADFSVHVWDWRKTLLDDKRFAPVHFLQGSSQTITTDISFIETDAIVIMTHDFQRDKQLLTPLLTLSKQVSYTGILGPRRRTMRLLHGKGVPEHLHAPLGLDIGADGPVEIAVSIMAAIIQAQRKGQLTHEAADYRNLSSGGKEYKV